MKEIFIRQPILPAVTFADANDALPVAEALLAGGLSIMEVALRTEAAYKAIDVIAKNLPEMKLGAGTILTVEQMQQAIDAGASFGLSPSLNPLVLEQADRHRFPFIPGVMTPSETETAYRLGYSLLKFFPASAMGGATFLKAMMGPYAHLNLQFIPMGGVHLQNMGDYLGLSNVIAVGGSWLATPELMAKKDFGGIEKKVREAMLFFS